VDDELQDLGMRLFHLMGALRRRFARDLARQGLTFPQFMALCSLEHADGKASRMGDLAAATHQSAASMTGIVDRLLEQGLVERRPDPADRRSVLVALTDEGAHLLERVRADRIRVMEHLLRCLSPGEQALLYDILGKLLSELSGETTPAGQL
jgi:DNA-binding MarR family transcriptional regulator